MCNPQVAPVSSEVNAADVEARYEHQLNIHRRQEGKKGAPGLAEGGEGKNGEARGCCSGEAAASDAGIPDNVTGLSPRRSASNPVPLNAPGKMQQLALVLGPLLQPFGV